ncbi:hypothetical protein GGI04_003899 [Coemansia thaxteri]|uniref:Uncharacterized protein n=1 Tax=Coemansia thaxteri TaxID=2663907 RepID=A0A9W8EFV9_9FUNG|nr:hypothetical protein H4R26_005412 [Coemansia thaxteri]KAJ2001043.1 hypothetical protein GGI04_003899 [Coemansia thaxteri]KAJ2482472.1 hypothetical protein EV174_003192 [Coemansia sp. RSA 2320]
MIPVLGIPERVLIAVLLLLSVALQVNGDFNLCNSEEWRPALKKAYIQQKNMPPPKSVSVKRVLEEELPKPYRILGPYAPYTRYRTHKRLTIYVDKNNMFQDVECS